MAMRWVRKGADIGHPATCLKLARFMYGDIPYAREVGHVVEVAAAARVVEAHDVPPEVMTSVVHWLKRWRGDSVAALDELREVMKNGGPYCFNDGCKVVGLLKEFKVCPQCKNARQGLPLVHFSAQPVPFWGCYSSTSQLNLSCFCLRYPTQPPSVSLRKCSG
jgi:hypothetical protein